MRVSWSTERKIVLGFGSALVALCIVAGISVWLTLALLGDLKVVAEQNKILTRISEANGISPQLATYARLLAEKDERDVTIFQEWKNEKVEFEEKLDEIDQLTNDSPTQRQRMTQLKQILDDKVRITTLNADKQLLLDAWGIKDGFSQMRPITDLLIAMSVEERTYLGMKNDQAKYEATAALWAIGSAFALALLLIGWAVLMILGDLRVRRRAAEELERARQAAETANVAKSAFLANMSHELRTPLTSIMGYVDLMLDPEAAAAGRAEYLQTMRRSGEHLLTLINDILDVSKIEAGRMGVEAVECRLMDVLAEIHSLMRARAIEKGIEFNIEYQTAIPERVKTDPTRFRQILMNLAGNAVKFTDEGGVRVAVSCKENFGKAAQGYRIVVEVIDTGVGIAPEQQRRLFQPFTQADISTTRRFGGTGLGLSISRRLAQMLGGDLSVRSEAGAGSTFRLSLPMDAVAGAAMIPSGEAGQLVRGGGRGLETRARALGLRVLLAEDGAENRDVIMLHLRHAGCVATAVEDGEQAYDTALRAWRGADPFDVVLMDMQMPVMDGYTATAKLRTQGYTGVIIALTAHAMKEDRDRCLRMGCDEYAAKPVHIPGLLRMMARFSGRQGGPAGVTDKLLQNPALRLLTRKFCDGIAPTLDALRELAVKLAWGELAMAAHRLAGAGGAYGFDEITRDAKALERAARAGARDEVEAALRVLAQTCAAARQRVEAADGPAITAEPAGGAAP